MYVIGYEYPGTCNGKPVGFVYVAEFHNGEFMCASYSKRLDGATKYATHTEAEKRRAKSVWPDSRVIEVAKAAPVLAP